MATTTTNYGFDVPTSSDLVKNGATAISTLGQDLDTFLFRPITQNGILNSSLNVWQRGTSVAISGASVGYVSDRWQVQSATASVNTTTTRQTTSDTTNLPNIQYCARVQRNSGVTATGFVSFQHTLETMNSIPFVGKTVTLSYYARAGANFSAASSALGVQLRTGTGTDQNVTGFTGSANPLNTTVTLTTTWQRFSSTLTLGTSITQIGLNYYYSTVGTAGANDYFEITGVQLEVGNQMSPYTPATPTYATELAACQRYYYQLGGISSAGGGMGNGHYYNTTNAYITSVFPVTMRTQPTCAAVNIANFQVLSGGSARATTAFGASSTSPYAATSAFTTALAVLGYGGWLDQTNANAALTFSAEL